MCGNIINEVYNYWRHGNKKYNICIKKIAYKN